MRIPGLVILAIAVASPVPLTLQARSLDTVLRGRVEATHYLEVGGLERSWLSITPEHDDAPSLPIVVVLSGINASQRQEVERDGFSPLVDSREAELVYPAGVGESWNAGGCCGEAAAGNVDDLAFLEALVGALNPTGSHPVDLVGFSDGGRLAYTVTCTDPGLFDKTAIVMAMPQPGCIVADPETILQVAGTADAVVPYAPGDPGSETPAVTVEVDRLRTLDRCRDPSTLTREGSLRLETWHDCARGVRLGFATYEGGEHLWLEGNATTPSTASVVWSFFNDKMPERPYFPPTPACAAYWC